MGQKVVAYVQRGYTGAKLNIQKVLHGDLTNITQLLISTIGLSWWCYGHAVIVTEVWGLIPPTNQIPNYQPTML